MKATVTPPRKFSMEKTNHPVPKRDTVNTLKTRKALLEWIPDAINHPLPAELTVSRCLACGCLDKQLTAKRSDEKT
jgi:hypothetical protein